VHVHSGVVLPHRKHYWLDGEHLEDWRSRTRPRGIGADC
jgi:hypothetical protein